MTTPSERPEWDDSDPTRLRTWVIAFEADDATAEVAAVVVGTILDNFRGLMPIEFTDETALASEGGEAMDVLHAVLTAEKRLTPEQREEIEKFAKEVDGWKDEGDAS